MKKSHLALLIIAAITALFSAYSLAAINQVYKINFEWYSQYNDSYSNEERSTAGDKWQLSEYPEEMQFHFIGNINSAVLLNNNRDIQAIGIKDADFGRYVYLYCTLGEKYSPEYKIKVVDIAQRGSVVEVKVSINSPAKSEQKSNEFSHAFYAEDTVRINKFAFPIKGKLDFIFKNQDGNQIYEENYEVR